MPSASAASATFPAGSTTYQGCHHPAVLSDGRLVFVGDYLDRGPDSRGVLETLMNLQRKEPTVICLRGNHEAMMRGIAAVQPGARTGDIGYAIQSFVQAERCSVVRDFCGHGLGQLFHDMPNILHYGRPGEGIMLKPGMFFTIEPMINSGRPEVKVLSDGWTAVTRDRSLSAQFEHTIGVTESGCEIFTRSPHGYDCPPYRIT